METINRQSAVHSLINREQYYPLSKVAERDQQQPPTPMTAPPLLSPTTMYPNHPPPPYTHSNNAIPSAHPISGLISPTQSQPPDSRRTSGDIKDPIQSQRQSLPSIHEALYPPNSFAAPRNNVDPPAARPYAAFPQHPPTPTSRANSMESAPYQVQINLAQPQQSSPPHPVHPSSYSRAEPMTPSYENSRHPPLPSIRTALPQQPTTLIGPDSGYVRHDKDARGIAAVSNGYPHLSSQHVQHPSHSAAPNPVSSAYSPQSPYPPQRPYRSRYEHGEEQSRNGENPPHQKLYGPVVKRHLDYWDIEIELANLKNCGNEVARISAGLLADAQQNTHHGSMPERMPSLHDLDLMRVQQEKLTIALQHVTDRVVAQGQYVSDQHGATPVGKVAEDYAQEDMSWEESRSMGGYGGPDAKKRRGRAAPPGRCHSCNRAETPEWRRGPDGARTLCNACGLHYAKLTRKLGSKNAQNGGSSLRPTSMGDSSPRS